MLHPCPENGLVMLLRPLYLAPRCRGPFITVTSGRGRAYSAKKDEQLTVKELTEVQKLKRIAVLGGGVTGLASAYYLTRELPNARIVLYERDRRLGGRVRSKTVDVGNGNVVFEQGPRTLRTNLPNGPVTMSLISQLGLNGKVVVTPRDSVAFRNRYIYYPDHLVRLPTPPTPLWKLITAVFTEPLFKGVPMSVLKEITKPKGQWKIDESIGSFFSRRFGPGLVNNLLSAMCHGIYAGDVWKLSAKSIFPFAYHSEETHGSVTKAMYKLWENEMESEAKIGGHGVILQKADADMILELREDMAKSGQQPKAHFWVKPGVYALRGGLETLTKALEQDLRSNKNVEIRANTVIKLVEPDAASGGIRVSEDNRNPPETYNHVISTFPASSLHSRMSNPAILPSLALTPTVTVMVVNLFFHNPTLLHSNPGFGYLIPSSIPFSQNPERALGVIFDTDGVPGQDSAPGTKITVMLGGHWWDEWISFPSEGEGLEMAKSVLQRHLGIVEKPAAWNVVVQKNSIPQYTVGHHTRMQKALWGLSGETWKGLSVAGASYNGVGVNDCIRGARDVVKTLGRGRLVTGLERYADDSVEWVRAVFDQSDRSGEWVR
ncbi:hypothetical protein FGG08_002688 [Glutinoglossum americanum]|uniref:Protoporphyrinogen oxidase n=1 Tax=Glutinoglossum americanum TaxID=1670608 RepID=A0A9P8L5C8_9PEZI|nr:hypothetical protein FGG08_002688 [Glutinoglossum americanum]